jgi:selenocysteine lyase/cysteine desulfurase
LYTDQEHSSNMLPWWKHWQKAIPAPSLPNGEPDFEKWEEILKSNDIALVACSAASNVTGYVSDVHSVARLAHRYGAKVVVDASQLAAHRKIERLEAGSPGHLDFVAFCGHKMYAPFGVGVLVGPTEMIRGEWPDSPGGGTVPLIEGRSIVWAEFPAREHSGTQNYLGVVALAEACAVLDKIGFETIADHEAALIQFGMERLANIPGVRMLRSTTDGSKASYLPIFPFAMEGVKSNLVGAYLGTEHGIGVRTGYLCQYDMVSKLLGLSMAERAAILISAKAGNLRPASGIVRASLGLSSTITDLSRLMDALVDFSDNGPCEQYTEDDDGSVKVVCK